MAKPAVKEEGQYTLQRVSKLPKIGNANWLYIIVGERVENFYRWKSENGTFEKIKIGNYYEDEEGSPSDTVFTWQVGLSVGTHYHTIKLNATALESLINGSEPYVDVTSNEVNGHTHTARITIEGNLLTATNLSDNETDQHVVRPITNMQIDQSPDTTFTTKPYAATMSVVHDALKPNFKVTVTGDLNLTVTGTENGDAGIVVLEFSGTQVATLNGAGNVVITGESKSVTIGWLNSGNGVVWDYSNIQSTTVTQKLNLGRLSNWKYKLANDPANATLAWVGDSTADLTGNASWLTDEVKKYTSGGNPLEGFDVDNNMINFGSNGQTIVGFIALTDAKGLQALVDAQLDLVIFSYGINDVRQNLLTKDELKEKIIYCINTIKEGSPSTDIVLRMPNSFDVPTTNGYIKQGSYASLAEAAQAQSTILYQAYKELEYYWSDVVLFDSQELVFGKTSSPTTPSVLHSDEIHPEYSALTKYLVTKIIGYTKPFREDLAKAAVLNSLTPWTIYPRVFELEPDFIKLGEGTLSAYGSTYTFISVDATVADKIGGGSFEGDYISIGKGNKIVKVNPRVYIGNSTRVRYNAIEGISDFALGTKVEFFRSRYANLNINKLMLSDKETYPYARKVRIGYAANNQFLMQYLMDDDIVTKYTKGLTVKTLELSNTDTMVFNDGTVVPLTNATFSLFGSGRFVRVEGVNFSPYLDSNAFLYGSRDYETMTKTGLVTLINGVGTVNSAVVTATSNVQISLKTSSGGVGAYYDYVVIDGVLTITSQSSTDTSTLTYTVTN